MLSKLRNHPGPIEDPGPRSVARGFAGAFRRSEFVGLNHADVEFNAHGLVIALRRSKTDQEGEGRKVALPYGSTFESCPLRSLQAWPEESGITHGPEARAWTF